MAPLNLKDLENLSQQIEAEIKKELQKALLVGRAGEGNQSGLEQNLANLPRTLAQALSPIFQMIGAIAGPQIRLTRARREKVIEQIQQNQNR